MKVACLKGKLNKVDIQLFNILSRYLNRVVLIFHLWKLLLFIFNFKTNNFIKIIIFLIFLNYKLKEETKPNRPICSSLYIKIYILFASHTYLCFNIHISLCTFWSENWIMAREILVSSLFDIPSIPETYILLTTNKSPIQAHDIIHQIMKATEEFRFFQVSSQYHYQSITGVLFFHICR